MLWKKLKDRMMDSTLLRKGINEYLKIQQNNSVDLEYERLLKLVDKVDEEEKKYAQLYGTGSLQFKNYQDLVNDVQKRRESLDRQIHIIKNRKMDDSIDIEPEELYNEAKSVVQTLDFNDKHKVIRDVVDKVIIKERSGVEVWAHIPLPSIQKLGNEHIGRDGQNTTRHSFPFVVKIKLPPPRLARQISQRDSLGKIVHSLVP
jgi:hypothetical protein